MAEFALGLTKTAVEGTLSLVKSAVEEEKKLRETVQNDLVFISGEFEMMRSFLHVANKERARNDEVVLTMVRQLRTLAFDVEDCVEYVVHLDLDDKQSSILGGLRRLWQTVNCRAPPLPLDVAVAEIKQLKDRVEYVSQRSTRYNLHDSNNNNNKQQYVAMPPLAEPREDATTYPSSPPFHILRDAWEATGNWCRNMCNLQDLIVGGEDGGLQVISVWGSTATVGDDLGTASILSEAYWHPEICKEFKSRAWVKLTHPFNQDEFVNSLLAQFYASSSSHQANAGDVDFWTRMKGKIPEEDKLPKLMQEMSKQGYLVVLDNVLAVEEWNVIRMYLPNSTNGSRIVVSTPRLGIALLCAGEPYQVSELTKFHGDNQFLCAFFKSKTRRDMVKFYHQLRRHSLISVWSADDDDKSNVVDKLYNGIINGWFRADHCSMLLEGIRMRIGNLGKLEFKRHSWVDVPDPFNLKVFARRLFLNFHSDDIEAYTITEGGKMGEEGLVKWCRESLFEKEDCLVVINGLQSTGDWDVIESNFFLKPIKGCILVVTNKKTVAMHCVNDHKYQAFNVKDLEADTSIATLINKASWYYDGIRGKKGRLLYDRRKHAREWANKFENVVGNNTDEGKGDVEEFCVFRVAVEDAKLNYSYPYKNLEGNRSHAGILRHAYYVAFEQIKCRSWVDVPFIAGVDLTDFAWRLLLDFYSDKPQDKEAIAVGLMEGTIDPIEKCREFLRNEKCLVVIDGLEYRYEWDLIKDTFFSERHIQSIIIVGATEDFYFDGTTKALQLGTQEQGRRIDMEYHSIFSAQKRYQEAIKWVQTRQPVGRDWEVNSLLGWSLTKEISVWGIPGVGKSTLVRTVYYNEMLRSMGPKTSWYDFRDLFEVFGWVDVPSPFNLSEFAWRLLLDLYSDDPQAKQTATVSMMEQGQLPILECCKILQETRCLVVVDGLGSTQDWDLIKTTFLSKPIKGVIVVITNEEEVAMHCVENDEDRVRNIRRLKADTALSLFEKIACEGKELTSSELELAKSIVVKCGGLPKVIAAIGEVCKSKIWQLRSLSRDFMGTLETDPEFHGLRPLFSWMQSYFDACSDSLKPCIFYLSIFSAEKNVRRRRLLWRWIAEGYCRDTSDGRTCEENGEEFISELVTLSIVQVSPSNEVFCQINGFFHEYIISRPIEDNLVFALEKGCSLNSARAGQHLTIRSSWNRRDRIVYESIDFSRLRSLTVFGEWKSFFICSNMRLLRVLDLEDATDVENEDLEQIAKLLTRLKFLSLRGHTKITFLPSSMGGLRQLQTLDIRGTSIVTLPLFIAKLQKLRYIRAGTATSEAWDWEEGVEDRASSSTQEGHVVLADGEEDRASSSAQAVTNVQPPVAATKEVGTDTTALLLPPDWSCTPNLVSSLLSKLCRNGSNGGDKVPAGIQKLAVLHTLGVVNVNVTSSAKSLFEALKEQQLTQLRKLGVSGINKGNIKEFCEAISLLAHLKSLSVEVDKDGDLDDNIHELPETIKSLKLYGYVNKLLVWVEQLCYNNLEKLKLDLTIEKPEELHTLEFRPRRVGMGHLRIRPIQGGTLHFQGLGWTFAEVVEIQCSSVLDIDWDVAEGVRGVRVLKVHFSGSRSSLQIPWLRLFKGLKEVWLKGYTDAQKKDMQRQIKDMELSFKQERPVLKLVQPRGSGTSSTSETVPGQCT